MLPSGISSVEHKTLRQALLIGSLLAVLVLALYWPVQSFDFVNLAEAEWHLNEALRVNRGSAEAHNNLGILRTAQGRMEDAIVCFLKARELAPGNAVIEENLRIACEKQQTNRLAKETL